MTVHPFADMFPLLRGEPYSSLCADIEEHGLREPLTMTAEGVLVDGRNRLAACKDVGVQPRYDVLPKGTSEVEILDVIMSKNLHRRHLDQTDRALLGVEYKRRFEAASVSHRPAGKVSPKEDTSPVAKHDRTSVARAAKAVGVSSTTIERAVRVIRDEPELAEKMRAKEITVSAADTERKRREDGKQEGNKPAESKRGSTRSTDKKVMAVLGQLSACATVTADMDPGVFSAEDAKEFSEHVTALNVFRRKFKEQQQ
jgi:ParB-like chromosome segregation protein Spo0J